MNHTMSNVTSVTVPLDVEWHYPTIAVSYLVAVLAAYSTVNVLQHPLSHVVTIFAAFGFSIGGIWSMHFIGMEAMLLGIRVEFQPGLTVASAAASFVCIVIALVLCKWRVDTTTAAASPDLGTQPGDVYNVNSNVKNNVKGNEGKDQVTAAARVSRTGTKVSLDGLHSDTRQLVDKLQEEEAAERGRGATVKRLVIEFLRVQWVAFRSAPHFTLNAAAWLIALGVCTMHYLGMEAMSTIATVKYNVPVVVVSVLIAVFAATAALYMALILPFTKQFVAPTALVMGVAVCGMHYTGMYGVTYEVDLTSPAYLAARRSKSPDRPWGFWVLALSTAYSFCLLAFNSYLYQRTLKENMKRGDAAVTASRTMAALLAAYDTERVSLVLAAYAASDNADSAVVQTYQTLLANLMLYRPFLPQYLFDRSSDDEDDNEHDGVDDGVEGGDSSFLSAGRGSANVNRQASAAGLGRAAGIGAESPGGLTMVSSVSTLVSVDFGGKAGSPAATPNNVAAPFLPPFPKRLSAPQSVALGLPSELQVFCGVVSFCRLHITVRPECLHDASTAVSQADRAKWIRRSVSAHQAAVVALHQIARQTSGSLHSVCGDAITCSWNATRRVHQPAAKAATFILRAQRALAQSVPCLSKTDSSELGSTSFDANASCDRRPIATTDGATAKATRFGTVSPCLKLLGVGFTGPAVSLLAGDQNGRLPVLAGSWSTPQTATGAGMAGERAVGTTTTIERLMEKESLLLDSIVVDGATAKGAETVADSWLVDAVAVPCVTPSPRQCDRLPVPLPGVTRPPKVEGYVPTIPQTAEQRSAGAVQSAGSADDQRLDFQTSEIPQHQQQQRRRQQSGRYGVPTTTGREATTVHVLLNEDRGGDDEWMYVLEKQAARKRAAEMCPLRRSIEAALSGDIDSAFAALDGVRQLTSITTRAKRINIADTTGPSGDRGEFQATYDRAVEIAAAKLERCAVTGLPFSETPVLSAADADNFAVV